MARMIDGNAPSAPLADSVPPTLSGDGSPTPVTPTVPGLATLGYSTGGGASTTANADQRTDLTSLGAIGAAPQTEPMGLRAIGGGSPAPPPASAPAPPPSGVPLLRQPIAPLSAPPSTSSYSPILGAYTPDPVLSLAAARFGNSSGMQGDVPAEVAGGFNFGAAIITFWWLRNHGLRPISWGLAAFYFILRMIGNLAGMSSAFVIVLVVQVVVFFALGFMGNRLAWQNRRFDDIEDFHACQRIWMYWSIPIICLQVGLFAAAVGLGGVAATHPSALGR